MPFYLTLATRFTGLRIKQASRKSTTGQWLLIKPECVKGRQAKREGESERKLWFLSLALSFLLSVSSFHIYTMGERERERKRRGEHKESARKVYNSLKPARHSLLYIKPVNSLGNVAIVPSTPPPHSLMAQDRK